MQKKFFEKIRKSLEKNYKIILIIFFILFLVIGIFIYKDYGISWDENTQRNTGIIAVNYILKGDTSLLDYRDRFYGPVFEILLVFIERLFNLGENLRAVFLMRHLVNFLLFSVSVFFFYKLCKYKFKSWKVGLIGALFLVFSPRIFAHSFFNSKDLAFLSLFIISIYTLINFLNNKTVLYAVLHSLICAFLIDIRILGIIVPAFTLLFFVIDLVVLKKTKKKKNKVEILSIFIYVLLLIGFVILFWPTLWRNPVQNFLQALERMSHYPWQGEILYFGRYIEGGSTPWHYIPAWIGITTPVVYLLLFISGCIFIVRSFVKFTRDRYIEVRDNIIIVLWFFIPIATVIALGSVVYDGWRQMFFVYPALLMISVSGLTSLWRSIGKIDKRKIIRNLLFIAVTVIIIGNLVFVGVFMGRYHPYQNVYFNPIVGIDYTRAKDNFEMDYWGLSYREALEYILANDGSKKISLFVANQPGLENSNILRQEDIERLNYVKSPRDADYFLSNYRGHKDEYSFKDEFYSISVRGAKIMVVYRLK